MNTGASYWHAPVAAVRPYLLTRVVLLLLAFDCWLNLLPHGARYGAGGFNVAHFSWLDWLVPSAELYSGAVTFCGLLSLAMVLFRTSRWLLGLLTAVYTLAWASSMLDSYQHHYLLSWILLCCTLLPQRTASELRDEHGNPKTTSAWSYVLCAVILAIVYAYTAATKLNADWRDGNALQRIVPARQASALVDMLGLEATQTWRLLALGAIALQLICALGYLLASQQDRPQPARWPQRVWILLPAPLLFHTGTELLHLEIGWFSYYVIATAIIFFAPRRTLEAALEILRTPRRVLETALGETGTLLPIAAAVPLAIVSLSIAVGICIWADLPGTLQAGIAAALALVLMETRVSAAEGGARADVMPALALAFATMTLGALLVMTTVRFDYYRYAGGDYRRRGEYEAALEAYVKANAYAPNGENRKQQEEEMRQKLGVQ